MPVVARPAGFLLAAAVSTLSCLSSSSGGGAERPAARPAFGGDVFDTQLRCAEYLSFVTTFILGMGVVFEVPAIMFALARVRLVSRQRMAGARRYVFLGVFVLAALITPTPDPFNQSLVAIPMYLLYELGLLLTRFAGGPRAAPAS